MNDAVSPDVKGSYRDLLSHRNYRLLLFSQIITAVGDGVYAIALIWLMKLLTGDAFLMSVLLAAESIPLTVLGMFSGVFVDRGSKRKIMMATDLFRGITVGLVVVIWIAGFLHPYMLILAALILSSCSAFFGPARMVSIRVTVPAQDLVQAQSLAQITQTVVGLTAPALGAFLLSYGVSYAFTFNAVTFFLSCGLILLIHNQALSQKNDTPMNASQFKKEFQQGIQAILHHSLLRNLILYLFILNFMFAPTSVLFPLMVSDPGDLAMLEIAFVLGIAIGALFSGALKKLSLILLLFIGIVLLLVGFGALYVVSGLYATALFLLVAGVGMPIANVALQTLFMLKVPVDVLGRATGIMRVLLDGSRPLALLLTGVLLDLISIKVFFGAIALVGCLLILLMLLNHEIRAAFRTREQETHSDSEGKSEGATSEA